jgi:hypothetical protein
LRPEITIEHGIFAAMKLCSAICGTLLLTSNAVAQGQPTVPTTQQATRPAIYRAKTWEDALRNLPCDAFRKVDPMTWAETGTIIVGEGGGEMAYGRLRSNELPNQPGTYAFDQFQGAAARLIEQRCGGPSSPQSGPATVETFSPVPGRTGEQTP